MWYCFALVVSIFLHQLKLQIMNINRLLTIILFSGATISLSSCSKEGCTDPNASNYDADAKTSNNDLCEYNYDVPETYVFTDADGNSTVSYSGQTARMDMLSEMVTYLKSAN